MINNVTSLSWFLIYFDNLCKDLTVIEKDVPTTITYLNNLISYLDHYASEESEQEDPQEDFDKMLALLLMLLSELAKSNLAAYYMMAWLTSVSLYKIHQFLSEGGKQVMKAEIVKLHNTYRHAFHLLLDARIASDSLSNLNLYEPRITPIINVSMAYGAIASLLIQFV